jgi:hypothetical protein
MIGLKVPAKADCAGSTMPTYKAISVAVATASSRARVLRAVFMIPLDEGPAAEPIRPWTLAT